jgi:hypothetical protein
MIAARVMLGSGPVAFAPSTSNARRLFPRAPLLLMATRRPEVTPM